MTLPTFREFVNSINEDLITIGGKAYPRFNTVVIMAGGAGSGKGFVQSNLLGVEGKTLDVDALKTLSQKTPGIVAKIKKDFGIDISVDTFSMKEPENVRALHVLLSNELKITDRYEAALFSSILTAPKDRLPNLIFDVTLKDRKKFLEISELCKKLGYKKENINLVWVVNDIQIAMEQNANRSRTVPAEILEHTHLGASMTMKSLITDGENSRTYMDGDIVFAFNKAKIDSSVVKSEKGGSYVAEANYVYIKRKGKPIPSLDKIGEDLLRKLYYYTGGATIWDRD
jgi:predicted kinase